MLLLAYVIHIAYHRRFIAPIIVGVLVLMGLSTISFGNAATFSEANEAEDGNLAGATVINDTTASNNKAVRFGPATLAAPSGEPMPVGDLPGWHQVVAEDFVRAASLGSFKTIYGSGWNGYDGQPDTSANGVYTPAKVLSVASGKLDMYIHTENGKHLVAAPVPPVPGLNQTYGRYSVRFRADPIPNYKTAWLLWPDGDWTDGEVDFPEGNLDDNISGYSHCIGSNPELNCMSVDTAARYTDWHTATIEWKPGSLSLMLDGKLLDTATEATAVPNTPMFWVLQTETGLDGVVPTDAASGHVEIDWVTAWSHT
jgi:hypothetical protein